MTGRSIQVTAIVPCYRAAETLRACLTSLATQEAPFDFEVLVVENGSDDDSLAIANEVAAEYPGIVRVIQESRPGAYAARNKGLDEARGAYIMFTDADCRASSGWMERMAQELADPQILMVGGEVVADPDQDSLVARYSARQNVLSQSHTLRHPRGAFLQTANLGVRAEDARVVRFDHSLFSGGDADFCWRLRAHRPDGVLRLVGDAVVHHSHRESLRDLYRQYRRYGQSDVLLGKKHGASWPHTIVKVGVDCLRVLLAPVLALVLLPFAVLGGDGVIAAGPLLRAVRVMARRVGQVKALLRPARLHRA